MRLGLSISIFLAGCFSPHPPNGSLQCHPTDHSCPTDYFCNMGDGRCYKNGFNPAEADLSMELSGDMPAVIKDLSSGDLAVGMGIVSPNTSTIDFAPPTPIANGKSSSVITVTVRDGFGTALEGKTVSLGTTGSSNVLVQPAAATGANGVASGTITSSVAETKTITATVDQVSFSADVTFSPVLAHSLVFTTPPGNKVNNSLPTLSVSALDIDNQLLTTTNVLITLDLMVPDAGNPGQYKVAPAGSMTGPNQQLTVNGIAQFSGLTIPLSATDYEMRASAQNVPPVFSSPFEVTSMSVATPGNVTAAVTNYSSITVSWDAVSGVAKYNIYRYPSQTGPFDQMYTVNVPNVSYLDKFLMHGTWSYKVDAEDGTGLKSAQSNFVSAAAERELCVVDGPTSPTYVGLVVVPAHLGTLTYPPLRTITAAAFSKATNLAVDMTNQLIYVSNLGDGVATTQPVHVFNRTDNSLAGTVTPIRTYNIASPTGATVKPTLHGIALDPVNSEFVVVESATPALIAYNTANTTTPAWTVSGTNVATPLTAAWGVALYRNASDTEIYVTTTGAAPTLVKYSRATIIAGLATGNYNGAPAVTITQAGINPAQSLSAPRVPFVYHGPASGTPPPVVGDNLYVMNATTGASGFGSVAWFPLPITVGGAITPAGQFSNALSSRAYAAAIDPDADTLYLLLNGAANNTINVFNTTGATNSGGISVTGSFGQPTDIAFCN